LVYADWLDDHGDADRAEFIRLQCELARPGEEDAGREALRQRADDLLAGHDDCWIAALPELPGIGWGWHDRETDFVRGFVGVTLSGIRARQQSPAHPTRRDCSTSTCGALTEATPGRGHWPRRPT